jgi:hypothetical protein
VIENGDVDGIDGDGVIEGGCGFGSFHESYNVSRACTEFVVYNKRGLGGDGRGGFNTGIDVLGIDRVHQKPARTYERGLVCVDVEFSDDVTETHEVEDVKWVEWRVVSRWMTLRR